MKITIYVYILMNDASMFHVKRLLIIALVIFQLSSYSQGTLTLQDKPFIYKEVIDSSIWTELQQNRLFQQAPKQEQMFFYWTNYFRKYPKKFFNTFVKDFIKQFPEANTADVKSLETDINNIKVVLPAFLPDAGLSTMAQKHSSDLIKRGNIISHRSSTGKEFVQRIKESGSYRCGAENIYFGSFDPLEALIALLVDYGVPDKGHRINLIDFRFGKMGVSFPLTSKRKGLLVQDFACF